MDALSRLLEEAADALARLDIVASQAPRSLSLGLRLGAICEIAGAGPKGIRSLLAVTLGVPDDGERDLLRLGAAIDEEERRTRGGAPLSVARLEDAGLLEAQADLAGETDPEDANAPDVARDSLRRLLRTTGPDRPPAILRAIEASALVGARGGAEAIAALLLVAEGRTDRIRMLPFGDAPSHERAAATRAWHSGDREPWTHLALRSLVIGARRRRLGLERGMASVPEEDARLDGLGRAAINARRALSHLRISLATTVPSLADELALSRPAASDAIERLVALGLVEELTGRRRDRAFAYGTALTLGAGA